MCLCQYVCFFLESFHLSCVLNYHQAIKIAALGFPGVKSGTVQSYGSGALSSEEKLQVGGFCLSDMISDSSDLRSVLFCPLSDAAGFLAPWPFKDENGGRKNHGM